ncbi:hypothetical protein V6N11_020342 [Hibiscus sabdariffa]|uniref:Uncharacterized protein n=1 Tax=Hibiscus sabdariffa TaxID=183260 RepID=A0ABR2Q845_9ROSI
MAGLVFGLALVVLLAMVVTLCLTFVEAMMATAIAIKIHNAAELTEQTTAENPPAHMILQLCVKKHQLHAQGQAAK